MSHNTPGYLTHSLVQKEHLITSYDMRHGMNIQAKPLLRANKSNLEKVNEYSTNLELSIQIRLVRPAKVCSLEASAEPEHVMCIQAQM